MGLFGSLGDLFGGLGDLAQNSVTDALQGLSEAPVVQDIQDQIGNVSELAQPLTGAVQEAQNLGEEITNKLGL